MVDNLWENETEEVELVSDVQEFLYISRASSIAFSLRVISHFLLRKKFRMRAYMQCICLITIKALP